MARGKETQIGNHIFPRQLDALTHFKAILNRYSLWDQVIGDDAADLEALITRHKDVAEKIGSGIRAFKIIEDDYRGRCFGIQRTDGTTVDFSYIRCVTKRWE